MATRRRKTKVIKFAPDKVKQPSGLKKDGTPNSAWTKFKDKLENFEQIPTDSWTEVEILGYLLKRYREHYEIDFSLSYSGPPSKCSEMFCIKRMLTTVGTTKGVIAKEYIDWVFDNIIKKQNTKITSLGFFFTANICNRFKSEFRKSRQITKSTELPTIFLDVVKSVQLNVKTYGDLAFLQLARQDEERDEQELAQYNILFEKLQNVGFNPALLNNL